MQQPLAHLYFLTVLEHLQAEGHKLSALVRTANNISKLCTSPPLATKAFQFLQRQIARLQAGKSLEDGEESSEDEPCPNFSYNFWFDMWNDIARSHRRTREQEYNMYGCDLFLDRSLSQSL